MLSGRYISKRHCEAKAEAIHLGQVKEKGGLPRRFAPRNDMIVGDIIHYSLLTTHEAA